MKPHCLHFKFELKISEGNASRKKVPSDCKRETEEKPKSAIENFLQLLFPLSYLQVKRAEM